MPLVLVSNEVNATDRWDWKDITGVQYHYPNGYRNLIRPGERFVYYRGMRRTDGQRADAEYFGCGVVGETWRDPDIPETERKGRWAWYCSIDDYVPFEPAVPAKIDGAFYETIPQNLWRNGVRRLDDTVFKRIVTAAGIEPPSGTPPSILIAGMPPLEEVSIPVTSTELLLARSRAAGNRTSGQGAPRRYSRRAAAIGNRAEQAALTWVKQQYPEAKHVRWVANDGETPGWDIEVTDRAGEVIAFEVKGTSGRAFPNFDLTDGELRACHRLGKRYWLLLVADCLGRSPRIQPIANPSAMFTSHELKLEPTQYRVSLALLQGRASASSSRE